MNVPTPPPSSKGSSAEPEFSTSPEDSESLSNSLEIEHSTQTGIPELNEPEAEIFERIGALAENPVIFEPRFTIKDVDTEMSGTPVDHGLCVKQEDPPPYGTMKQDVFNAALELAKYEEIEIKSEATAGVMSIKDEFEPEAASSEQTWKQSGGEGRTEKPKKARRAPAKTAREYHQRKHQDSTSGIRKVRKIIRNTNPEKLLKSIAHQDQVSAYNAGPSNGTAPVMAVTTKKDFMQQILSSCPEDAFQKFKTELNILDEESRSFGFKRMEMKNGMWMLKGMKSRRSYYILALFLRQPNLEFSCLSLSDEGCCLDGGTGMFCRKAIWWNPS
jgi:hypothetical protein